MQLQLFGTAGCHLCEQAEAIVVAYGHDAEDLTLELIDIADHPGWLEKYMIRIPVLRHPKSQNELGWPFDYAAVKAFIAGLTHDD